MTELTPQQIENWRKALSVTLGPYALIMPAADVRKLHAKMQNDIHNMATDANIKKEKPVVEVDEGAQRYWLKKLKER